MFLRQICISLSKEFVFNPYSEKNCCLIPITKQYDAIESYDKRVVFELDMNLEIMFYFVLFVRVL